MNIPGKAPHFLRVTQALALVSGLAFPLITGCGGRATFGPGEGDCDSGDCVEGSSSPEPEPQPGPPTGVQPAPEPVDAQSEASCCGISGGAEAGFEAEGYPEGGEAEGPFDGGGPPDVFVADVTVKHFEAGGPLDPPDLPA